MARPVRTDEKVKRKDDMLTGFYWLRLDKANDTSRLIGKFYDSGARLYLVLKYMFLTGEIDEQLPRRKRSS